MKGKNILKLVSYVFLSALLFGLLAFVIAKAPSVLAQIEISKSSQGDIVPSDSPGMPEVIGDDPDEVGYTGSSPLRSIDIIPSQDSSGPENSADSYFPEPLSGPDVFTPGIENQSINAVAHFYSAAGSTFLTVESSQSWTYDYMGCIHNTTDGFSLVNLDLQLPDGAQIVLLRVYYDDTLAGTTGNGWITRYPVGGTTFEDLVNVPTVGSAGHGSNYGNLNHIVDNYNNSYVLNWRANIASSGMQLCGMRVMYYP